MAGKQGLHSKSTHNVIEPFKRKEPVRGKCVAWIVVDGKAQQCGKRCKGQYCDEHAGKTRPTTNQVSGYYSRGWI